MDRTRLATGPTLGLLIIKTRDHQDTMRRLDDHS